MVFVEAGKISGMGELDVGYSKEFIVLHRLDIRETSYLWIRIRARCLDGHRPYSRRTNLD